MGKIVAIGGGEISKRETYTIDQEIIKLSGKNNPKTLFVPTASYEPEGYCECFKNLYEKDLGAEVEVLYLLNNELTINEIEEKINWADIIYVGGGDTSNMLKVWREKKVDKFLKAAYEKGTLLCGLSAGSICWFEYGQSEIESETSEDGYEYITVQGLGLIPGFHCPHYNEGRRAEVFDQMIQTSELVGIALDNNCAMIFVDANYRILTSEADRKAYKVYALGEKARREEIQQVNELKNKNEVYK